MNSALSLLMTRLTVLRYSQSPIKWLLLLPCFFRCFRGLVFANSLIVYSMANHILREISLSPVQFLGRIKFLGKVMLWFLDGLLAAYTGELLGFGSLFNLTLYSRVDFRCIFLFLCYYCGRCYVQYFHVTFTPFSFFLVYSLFGLLPNSRISPPTPIGPSLTISR